MSAPAAGFAGAALQAAVGEACACRTCLRQRDARDATGWPILMGFMVVCMTCGNKRCPHAEDHANACTNSNEPGQLATTPRLPPHTEEAR